MYFSSNYSIETYWIAKISWVDGHKREVEVVKGGNSFRIPFGTSKDGVGTFPIDGLQLILIQKLKK